MSKTKEYIEKLREFHEDIIRLEDSTRTLSETISKIDCESKQMIIIPEKNKHNIKADLEAVRYMLAKQTSKGLTQEIKELFKKFGANKLSDIDPKHYKDLYYSLESLDK
ncbi:hypothetical protein [Lactobacillus sp. ESL0703]|uniref:hypothetical protein n=1 Tax=Lactobacillus sp. ESL0703 TaxID=2983218 RepID=UPI0023F91287|nr:hypothetical protein [Lactobacillus sp. ESL0703]MDF7669330.1 hypothetical protein [Lactobacillus sp. ESL0703]